MIVIRLPNSTKPQNAHFFPQERGGKTYNLLTIAIQKAIVLYKSYLYDKAMQNKHVKNRETDHETYPY